MIELKHLFIKLDFLTAFPCKQGPEWFATNKNRILNLRTISKTYNKYNNMDIVKD